MFYKIVHLSFSGLSYFCLKKITIMFHIFKLIKFNLINWFLTTNEEHRFCHLYFCFNITKVKTLIIWLIVSITTLVDKMITSNTCFKDLLKILLFLYYAIHLGEIFFAFNLRKHVLNEKNA